MTTIDDLDELFKHFNIKTNDEIDALCNQFDDIKIESDKFILTKNYQQFIIYRIKKCCLEYKYKIDNIPYIN